MAYTDLVSTGITLVADTATSYNFAYDTPIASDGSPHIVKMGLQLDATMADNPTFTSTLAGLITSVRIKVGSNIIVDWNDPVGIADSEVISQLGVVVQRIGGEDWLLEYNQTSFKVLSQLTFPMGLDATKTHRVNVTLGFADVSTWSSTNAGFNVNATELNMVLDYGTATEATIIGSRQDFIISADATRTITVYGKQGWSMLGVHLCGDSATDDQFSKVRINNGAFRELTLTQWRSLNNAFGKNPLQYLPTALSGGLSAPQYKAVQEGSVFLNLRRITAGANIDMAITEGQSASNTASLFPVWVAPIGKGSGKAPKQTAKSVQSTTSTVETNAQ